MEEGKSATESIACNDELESLILIQTKASAICLGSFSLSENGKEKKGNIFCAKVRNFRGRSGQIN